MEKSNFTLSVFKQLQKRMSSIWSSEDENSDYVESLVSEIVIPFVVKRKSEGNICEICKTQFKRHDVGLKLCKKIYISDFDVNQDLYKKIKENIYIKICARCHFELLVKEVGFNKLNKILLEKVEENI